MTCMLLFIYLGGGKHAVFYFFIMYIFQMNLLLLLEPELLSYCVGSVVF